MPDISFKNYAYVAVGVNLLILLIVLISQRFLPPYIPLFYGLAEGEEQLAPSFVLTIPSLVSILIIVLNISISSLAKDIFLKRTLILAAVVATIFSLITTIKIILLVGSF